MEHLNMLCGTNRDLLDLYLAVHCPLNTYVIKTKIILKLVPTKADTGDNSVLIGTEWGQS